MAKHLRLLLIIVLMLTGCVEKEILDDISIESALGLDYHNKDEVVGTGLVPIYLPDKSVKNATFSAKSSLKRELFMEIQRQAPDPLVIGSLEVVLFGKKLAEAGIFDLIDALQRDATIGERLYLAVVDGKAEDILKKEYGTRGNSTYISNIIKQNIKSRDLPTTNLHMFIFNFFQDGKDPFLPRIKQKGEENLILNGICIFKKDKVVTTIPGKKMFFFKLLVDKHSEGGFKLQIGKEEALIRSIRSRHRYTLTKKKPYEITINISITGAIREFSGKEISGKTIKKIEKQLEQTVNEECMKLIKSFQEKGVDPLGLGHFAKTKTRNFDFKKWNNTYKNVSVKVKTDAKIIDAGIIE